MPWTQWETRLDALLRTEWLETARAAAIVAVAIVIAAVVSAVMRWAVHRYTRTSEASLDDTLVRALRGPAVAFIVVQGIAIAARTLSYLADRSGLIDRLWLAVSLFVLVIAFQRVTARLLHWYAGRPAIGRGARLDARSLPVLRRVVSLAVWLAGGLVVLSTLGIEISPLLAGLGLGGLAVALALQPLLTNVFASSYMLSDQSIRIGDQVEMAGGPSGVIEDIGWRATRIRGGDNRLIIVPNATLASAIVANLAAGGGYPAAEVVVHVAASEDLGVVEAICRAELTRIAEEAPAAAPGQPVTVQYEAFDAGAVRLLLKIRAATWGDVGALRHDVIRRVHARLRAEGIDLK